MGKVMHICLGPFASSSCKLGTVLPIKFASLLISGEGCLESRIDPPCHHPRARGLGVMIGAHGATSGAAPRGATGGAARGTASGAVAGGSRSARRLHEARGWASLMVSTMSTMSMMSMMYTDADTPPLGRPFHRPSAIAGVYSVP